MSTATHRAKRSVWDARTILALPHNQPSDATMLMDDSAARPLVLFMPDTDFSADSFLDVRMETESFYRGAMLRYMLTSVRRFRDRDDNITGAPLGRFIVWRVSMRPYQNASTRSGYMFFAYTPSANTLFNDHFYNLLRKPDNAPIRWFSRDLLAAIKEYFYICINNGRQTIEASVVKSILNRASDPASASAASSSSGTTSCHPDASPPQEEATAAASSEEAREQAEDLFDPTGSNQWDEPVAAAEVEEAEAEAPVVVADQDVDEAMNQYALEEEQHAMAIDSENDPNAAILESLHDMPDLELSSPPPPLIQDDGEAKEEEEEEEESDSRKRQRDDIDSTVQEEEAEEAEEEDSESDEEDSEDERERRERRRKRKQKKKKKSAEPKEKKAKPEPKEKKDLVWEALVRIYDALNSNDPLYASEDEFMHTLLRTGGVVKVCGYAPYDLDDCERLGHHQHQDGKNSSSARICSACMSAWSGEQMSSLFDASALHTYQSIAKQFIRSKWAWTREADGNAEQQLTDLVDKLRLKDLDPTSFRFSRAMSIGSLLCLPNAIKQLREYIFGKLPDDHADVYTHLSNRNGILNEYAYHTNFGNGVLCIAPARSIVGLSSDQWVRSYCIPLNRLGPYVMRQYGRPDNPMPINKTSDAYISYLRLNEERHRREGHTMEFIDAQYMADSMITSIRSLDPIKMRESALEDFANHSTRENASEFRNLYTSELSRAIAIPPGEQDSWGRVPHVLHKYSSQLITKLNSKFDRPGSLSSHHDCIKPDVLRMTRSPFTCFTAAIIELCERNDVIFNHDLVVMSIAHMMGSTVSQDGHGPAIMISGSMATGKTYGLNLCKMFLAPGAFDLITISTKASQTDDAHKLGFINVYDEVPGVASAAIVSEKTGSGMHASTSTSMSREKIVRKVESLQNKPGMAGDENSERFKSMLTQAVIHSKTFYSTDNGSRMTKETDVFQYGYTVILANKTAASMSDDLGDRFATFDVPIRDRTEHGPVRSSPTRKSEGTAMEASAFRQSMPMGSFAPKLHYICGMAGLMMGLGVMPPPNIRCGSTIYASAREIMHAEYIRYPLPMRVSQKSVEHLFRTAAMIDAAVITFGMGVGRPDPCDRLTPESIRAMTPAMCLNPTSACHALDIAGNYLGVGITANIAEILRRSAFSISLEQAMIFKRETAPTKLHANGYDIAVNFRAIHAQTKHADDITGRFWTCWARTGGDGEVDFSPILDCRRDDQEPIPGFDPSMIPPMLELLSTDNRRILLKIRAPGGGARLPQQQPSRSGGGSGGGGGGNRLPPNGNSNIGLEFNRQMRISADMGSEMYQLQPAAAVAAVPANASGGGRDVTVPGFSSFIADPGNTNRASVGSISNKSAYTIIPMDTYTQSKYAELNKELIELPSGELALMENVTPDKRRHALLQFVSARLSIKLPSPHDPYYTIREFFSVSEMLDVRQNRRSRSIYGTAISKLVHYLIQMAAKFSLPIHSTEAYVDAIMKLFNDEHDKAATAGKSRESYMPAIKTVDSCRGIAFHVNLIAFSELAWVDCIVRSAGRASFPEPVFYRARPCTTTPVWNKCDVIPLEVPQQQQQRQSSSSSPSSLLSADEKRIFSAMSDAFNQMCERLGPRALADNAVYKATKNLASSVAIDIETNDIIKALPECPSIDRHLRSLRGNNYNPITMERYIHAYRCIRDATQVIQKIRSMSIVSPESIKLNSIGVQLTKTCETLKRSYNTYCSFINTIARSEQMKRVHANNAVFRGNLEICVKHIEWLQSNDNRSLVAHLFTSDIRQSDRLNAAEHRNMLHGLLTSVGSGGMLRRPTPPRQQPSSSSSSSSSSSAASAAIEYVANSSSHQYVFTKFSYDAYVSAASEFIAKHDASSSSSSSETHWAHPNNLCVTMKLVEKRLVAQQRVVTCAQESEQEEGQQRNIETNLAKWIDALRAEFTHKYGGTQPPHGELVDALVGIGVRLESDEETSILHDRIIELIRKTPEADRELVVLCAQHIA